MGLTSAFLQARMGSTRLPGKVLMRIQGKTILERAIERLRAARSVDSVVVLTTTLDADLAVVREARRAGAAVFRGPDLDVLARFCQAADLFQPDIIVRATADNPLIDIGSVDRIVAALKAGDLDYCMEAWLPVGAATEVMTRAALCRVGQIGLLTHHREHVTIYVKEHPEEFRTAFLEPPGELRLPHLRITVDTPADLEFVGSLIDRLPDGEAPIPLLRYLESASLSNSAPRR
jgi:spore coat polysaccharide biosynthesis protein SpsF